MTQAQSFCRRSRAHLSDPAFAGYVQTCSYGTIAEVRFADGSWASSIEGPWAPERLPPYLRKGGHIGVLRQRIHA